VAADRCKYLDGEARLCTRTISALLHHDTHAILHV
jgi:hypothetical protein